MDSKTSLVILERVKAAREKQAAGGADQLLADIGQGVRDNPMSALGAALGTGGYAAMQGGMLGGVAGAGYGTAKKRPFAGALRGAGRGALTLGGAGLGGMLGALGGAGANLGPGGALAAGLGGAALGGLGGWAGADKLMGKEMEEKQGNDPSIDAFADALQGMAATQLRSDAFRDVRNVGLTALGVGAAGRGLVGLLQHMRANKPKKTRSGPAYLPLPFPAQPEKVGSAGTAVGDVTSAAGTDLGAAAGGLGGAAMAQKALARMPGGMRGKGLAGLGAVIAGSVAGGLGGNRMARGGIGREATQPGAGQLSTAVGDNLAATGALGGAGVGGAAGLGAGLGATSLLGKIAPKLAGRGKMGLLAGLGTAGLGAAGAYQGGVGGNSVVRSMLGRDKAAGFLDGDMATTKGGIPWYGPAMLLGGLGGLGLGWKGMDHLIDGQRKKQMEGELVSARQQFHDALLGQYDKPVEMHPELIQKKEKAAADATMEKVGQALDALYDQFTAAMAAEDARPTEKAALDLSNLAGQAAGGYGMYAGLTGLLTGALVYDKINKRSRRAVLDAALKKRQRRRFMQQPTEIYAQPEPVSVGGME